MVLTLRNVDGVHVEALLLQPCRLHSSPHLARFLRAHGPRTVVPISRPICQPLVANLTFGLPHKQQTLP